MSCVRKEKNRRAIFKKQKNALRILNLLSGVLGRCILSFFARTEFHSSDFPPPLVRTMPDVSLWDFFECGKKNRVFFPIAISSLWSACLQSFFSRMSLVLKHKIADKNKSIKILTKHVSQLNKVFLLKLTPLEVWNFYRFFIALWISERKLK
jgi:hypothetical protein